MDKYIYILTKGIVVISGILLFVSIIYLTLYFLGFVNLDYNKYNEMIGYSILASSLLIISLSLYVILKQLSIKFRIL